MRQASARTHLRRSRIGEQTFEFLLDDLVAFAGPFFQSGPVEHSDVTAVVTDKPRALQLPGGFRDALATHTERTGDRFLRHSQFIRG